MGFTITGGLVYTSGLTFTAVAAGDPYFNYTTLLLPGNGTNNGTNNTFIDGSTNNLTVTRNGSTIQGAVSPFSLSGWSNYFNGSSDALTVTGGGSAVNFTSSYTVEGWFYLRSNLTYIGSNTIYFARILTAQPGGLEIYIASANSSTTTPSQIAAYSYTGPSTVASATNLSMPIETWHHFAVCRDASNVTSIYLNGTRVATGTVSGTYASRDPEIGGSPISTNYLGYFPGYISNFRVVKGSTVYDPTQTTITVPTAPLTAIANTSLLTCQSGYFKDNSTNAYTITPTSGPKVQAFNPFLPSAAYVASTNGGSGYFNGSTDYLSIAYNTALNLSSGDFTVEGWFYCTTLTSSNQEILDKDGVYNSTYSSYGCAVTSSGKFIVGLGNGAGVSPSFTNYDGTTTVPLNTWNHFAFVRTGTTIKVFFNGTQTVSTAQGTAMTDGGKPLLIGYQTGQPSALNFNGYISNIRILKGTALYTSSFTVPTAPLTAIANTSLLLNMTNAQVIDNTISTDLITSGNAVASTSQYKWGTSSIYLNGTSNTYLISEPSSLSGELSTGDFTIEFWMNASAAGTYVAVVGTQTIAGNATAGMWRVSNRFNSSNGIYFNYTTGSAFTDITFTTTNYNDSTWHHVAVTRSSGTLRAFVDGTQVGSNQTVTQSLSSGQKLSVGWNAQDSQFFTGYVQDVRITKGYARYTSNFTAPTAALPTY